MYLRCVSAVIIGRRRSLTRDRKACVNNLEQRSAEIGARYSICFEGALETEDLSTRAMILSIVALGREDPSYANGCTAGW